jgi:hypothetical protein
VKAEYCGVLELLLNPSQPDSVNSYVIVIADDFNFLDTAFLESDFGLDQVVENPIFIAIIFWTNSSQNALIFIMRMYLPV